MSKKENHDEVRAELKKSMIAVHSSELWKGVTQSLVRTSNEHLLDPLIYENQSSLFPTNHEETNLNLLPLKATVREVSHQLSSLELESAGKTDFWQKERASSCKHRSDETTRRHLDKLEDELLKVSKGDTDYALELIERLQKSSRRKSLLIQILSKNINLTDQLWIIFTTSFNFLQINPEGGTMTILKEFCEVFGPLYQEII